MPINREPSPEEIELLKSFCTHSEIAAVSSVARYDLVDVFRAEDAVLFIITSVHYPVFSPTHLPAIRERMKFELGIRKVVFNELPDPELQNRMRLNLAPGPMTDRKFLGYYTRVAKAIIQPYLGK